MRESGPPGNRPPGGPTPRLPVGPVLVEGETAFDVVAIAGSLGGPEALRAVVGGLPAWFPAAVLVVQHRTLAAQQLTVDLLERATPLRVTLARPGDWLQPGVVAVLPADRQLVLDVAGQLVPGQTPSVLRSAADPLFASVARWAGPRALGVVLSGTGDDGAEGVLALKQAGGRILVQDRASARAYGMPAAAIATGCVDLVLPPPRLAHALLSLVAWPGADSLLRVPLAPWAIPA